MRSLGTPQTPWLNDARARDRSSVGSLETNQLPMLNLDCVSRDRDRDVEPVPAAHTAKNELRFQSGNWHTWKGTQTVEAASWISDGGEMDSCSQGLRITENNLDGDVTEVCKSRDNFPANHASQVTWSNYVGNRRKVQRMTYKMTHAGNYPEV